MRAPSNLISLNLELCTSGETLPLTRRRLFLWARLLAQAVLKVGEGSRNEAAKGWRPYRGRFRITPYSTTESWRVEG